MMKELIFSSFSEFSWAMIVALGFFCGVVVGTYVLNNFANWIQDRIEFKEEEYDEENEYDGFYD